MVDATGLRRWRQVAGSRCCPPAIFPARRRRLRPAAVVPLFRRRPAAAVRQRSPAGDRRARTISAFLQRLWDSGLRVSQSVRTPAECAELHDQNIELNISLLDQRFLAGDRALYAKLLERLPRFIHSQRDSLVRNLAASRASATRSSRHLLSPGAEHQGNSRRLARSPADRWLDQIRKATPQRLAMAESMPELRGGAALPHAICAAICITSPAATTTCSPSTRRKRWRARDAAAHWMRAYFRHARDIYRRGAAHARSERSPVEHLFSQFRDWRSRLSNADFTVSASASISACRSSSMPTRSWCCGCFEFVARHGIRLVASKPSSGSPRGCRPCAPTLPSRAALAGAARASLAAARAVGAPRHARDRRI